MVADFHRQVKCHTQHTTKQKGPHIEILFVFWKLSKQPIGIFDCVISYL